MEGVGKQSFERWKELLDTWDLRVIILFSLFFQTFLFFFAPLRKRTGSSFIIIPIWLAYLLADLTANFALGLISRRQGDTSGPFARPELVAFWVPFLLLHLGGPDTIIGFWLEDNELWLRQLLHLLFLCGTTAYGFLVDLRFSYRQQDESQTFFLRRTARDAFKVVEAELNFIYEILYSKVRVLQGKYGYLLRFVSFILIVVALVLFCLIDKHKQGFHKFDVRITFTLLLGAIALDIIAFLMLLLSDRTAVALTNSDDRSIVFRMLKKSLNFNRKRWPEDSPTQHCTCSFGWFMQIMRRRWSESIPQYNYIDYCLHPRLQIWGKLIGFFGLTKMLDGLQYAKTVEFTNDLREFVFQ
ncbi:hypothetical protein TEA_009392 [Camellia sinensis var. sinensis]|uniref:DUF4220 domain-containing protein n=1 Tax=Camellia sinensis var. sinensis TaxID=542762 RepID=A0A4S4D197_CAMSN|nr:hypothetical protein TEA_009392 [Camellia sinensis var. sinensis]